MTKTLIFGAGGVGSVYGWFLEKAGVQVTAACRSNYKQVRDRGILIRSAKWGNKIHKPIAVSNVQDAQPHGPFDFVFVCSKAFPETHTLIKDAVTPDTTIVLAQNGIGIEEAYKQAYPENTLISGVVYLPVVQVEPGVVEHTTLLELFEIGTYPAQDSKSSKERVEMLAALWTKAGAKCAVYEDIQAQRWYKLGLNATLNSVCALTLCDDGNFLKSSEGAVEMAYDIMREVGRVASALNYNVLSEETIHDHMKRHIERMTTGGKDPSMLQDIRKGNAIEVEAILGNTFRIARDEAKVDTPYLRLLYTLAKGLNFAVTRPNGWTPVASVV